MTPLSLTPRATDGNQGDVFQIENNSGSPFTYTFNVTTDNAIDANDLHICHFFSLNGTGGNTQTFQYLNTPGTNQILWQESGSSVISATSSSSSSTATATSTSTNTPAAASANPTGSSTPTADPSSSSSSSHSIGAGAAVGITLGVLAVLAALGALLFFMRRRKLRHTRNNSAETKPAMSDYAAGDPSGHYDPKSMGIAAAGPPGGDGAYAQTLQMRKMGELDGQHARSEMDGSYGFQDARKRSEMDASYGGAQNARKRSEMDASQSMGAPPQQRYHDGYANQEPSELPGE